MAGGGILSSQVVSLPFQSVILEVANFCAAMDTLIDQDVGGEGGGLFSAYFFGGAIFFNTLFL